MMIKSPLNYTGGKFKILDQLFKLIPKSETFVDLFGGGFNVGINSNSKNIIYNDINTQVYNILKCFYCTPKSELFTKINYYIKYFNLFSDDKDELKKYYLIARKYYNDSIDKDSVLLFVLLCYSFNNMIRFNLNDGYNVPFGKRDFNSNIQKNLTVFKDKLQDYNHNYLFYNKNFYDLEIPNNSYVFCDPPYLISQASYNNIWNETQEQKLYSFLDGLNSENIKFGLTNVVIHKNKTNNILDNWTKKYNIHNLNNNFTNCNYHKTKANKKAITKEIC